MNAGGNPQATATTAPPKTARTAWPASGPAGIGMFYRNSHNRIATVTDGLSNTIFVGERCGTHSPTTWTGAVTGGRCPAWMATTPWTTPNTPPSRPQYRKWHRLRQCGLRRSLVPRPRQRHAHAQRRQPVLRPRYVLEHAPGWSEFPVRRRLGAFPHERHRPGHVSIPMTIAGGEVANDW